VISVQSAATTTTASKSDTRITLRRWQLNVMWGSAIRETSGADVLSSTTWSRSPLFAESVVVVVVVVVVVFGALVE
jgi:nucleoside recognition membrane protein YjiH